MPSSPHKYIGVLRHTDPSTTFKAYTYAASATQAVRYFCSKYPYLSYILDLVRDLETGQEFTLGENNERD